MTMEKSFDAELLLFLRLFKRLPFPVERVNTCKGTDD